MKKYSELSEHDRKLLDKIKRLDEGGFACWTEISLLADNLEDEEHKALWKKTCSHYNHMEEASIGELWLKNINLNYHNIFARILLCN